MAEETIGRATIQLGADGSKLAPEMAAAVAKAQGALDRANKQMERAQAQTVRAIQGHIDKINATRPTHEMRLLEQAVLKLGGSSKLSGDQLKRVTFEVNALAAAGAKVPASLQGLTGIGSKLGAAFQSLTTGGGVSGALAAIGPAAVAAGGALAVFSAGAFKAVGTLSELSERGTAVIGVRTAFEKLAGDYKGLLNASREATGGMISDFDLMQTANKGLLLGLPITSKEMDVLGRTAVSLGKAMNVGPTQALSDLITGLGRGSAAILDNLGITVKAEAAQKAYAESIGKSASDLTESEKKLAIYRAAIDAAEKSVNQIGKTQDTVGDATQKLTAQWANLKDALAEIVTTNGGAIEGMTDLANAIGAVAAHIRENKAAFDLLLTLLAKVSGFSGVGQLLKLGGLAITSGPKVATPIFRPGDVGEPGGFDATAAALQARALKVSDDIAKVDKKAAAQAKKDASELLGIRKKYNELQVSIVKGMESESQVMRDLDQLASQLLKTQEGIEKARLGGIRDTRLREGDFLPSIGGSGLFTRFQDVIDQEMENAAAKTEKAAAETKDWSSSLDSLANQLQTLAATTGGLTGKILSFAASLSSGLGGIISGFQGLKSGGGGVLGTLGKLSSGLGIIGSAVGVVGGLIGGIKSLFGGKSKEQKAAEAEAKKQAAEEAKQAKIRAAEEKNAALLNAKTFAESLQERLAKGDLSEGLTKSLSVIVGKIGDALLKSGLGILDQRLKDSEKFTAGQGLAADIAGALAEAAKAGIFDQGLAAAGGEAAQALLVEQTAAAAEAGLSQEEATRAGFAAIAPILQQQLNASIRSGQELDENTKRLLEEAKANGIEILADPAIESLGVQKEQLGVLRQIAGGSGGAKSGDVPAAGGFGPMITPNLGGGLGPRIQTHPGELAMVIPRSKMGPGGLISAAGGLYAPIGHGARAGSSRTSINLTIAEDPFQSSEGRERLRRYTLRTVERQTSKRLGALIASGRA